MKLTVSLSRPSGQSGCETDAAQKRVVLFEAARHRMLPLWGRMTVIRWKPPPAAQGRVIDGKAVSEAHR